MDRGLKQLVKRCLFDQRWPRSRRTVAVDLTRVTNRISLGHLRAAVADPRHGLPYVAIIGCLLGCRYRNVKPVRLARWNGGIMNQALSGRFAIALFAGLFLPTLELFATAAWQPF